VKVGDLVLVSYGSAGGDQVGTYVRLTEWAPLTRADILYSDGEVLSTPLCQIEVISESR
jgi:hypothetical protein